MQAGMAMMKNLNNSFLGTEGYFHWHLPHWLGVFICKITTAHKQSDPEFGTLHCIRCETCLYKFTDPALKDLLCPDCQMTHEQYERWMNCDNDDCLQECLNG